MSCLNPLIRQYAPYGEAELVRRVQVASVSVLRTIERKRRIMLESERGI